MNTTTITISEDSSFTVCGLTLPEVSAILRRSRSALGAFTSHRSENFFCEDYDVLQAAMWESEGILNVIVSTALVDSDSAIDASTLSLAVKLAALGAIARHTMEFTPQADLTTTIAAAAISAMASSTNTVVQASNANSTVN